MEPMMQQVLGLSPAGFHGLVYWDWPGPTADAPCLVAMHCLTRNGRDFDTAPRALSAPSRVVCPDVVGRGRSAWLADGALYGYPQYMADAASLITRVATGP